MKRQKLYFKNDAENCYTIEHHIDQMKFNGETEREVFRAKAEHGTGMFFCKKYQEVGEVNGTCGKQCKAYQPRNGKSGICKHYGFVYEQTDEIKILKLIEINIKKLTDEIIKVFPKFFDNFEGWEYGNGVDAGKDFKKIYILAKMINAELKNTD